MLRCCIWMTLLLPLFGAAQKFTAADLRQLKIYSTGVFGNNENGVKPDSGLLQSDLLIKPIWQKRKDGLWMFVEKSDTGHYYQVWHYYLQDDSTLVLQFFDFKDPEKALLLHKDIKQQSNLYLYNLFTSHGCDVYLKKNNTGFAGHTSGRECFTSIPGAEYNEMKIDITKDAITWQQTPFDKENKEVRTALNGLFSYKLKRPRNK